MSLSLIEKISPNQLAIPELRDKTMLEILKKLYGSFPAFSLSWLDFRNELHMTADKDLFIEEYKTGLLPLYEGKMIHQYNANFALPTYFLDTKQFDERLTSKEIYRMKQDLEMDNKAFKKFCEENAIDAKDYIAFDREFIRFGFRGIASDTNERTGIFSLLPLNCGIGNSMFANVPKAYYNAGKDISVQSIEIEKILFAFGVFNSIVIDFIVRSMVQINFNKIYLERIPFPQPTIKEIRTTPLYLQIIRDALALQRYHDKNRDFAMLDSLFGSEDEVIISKYQSAFGLGGKPLEIPKTEKAYLTLKARLDITIAKLYGLNKAEFQTILSTFKVLNNKQPHYIALLDSLWDGVGE